MKETVSTESTARDDYQFEGEFSEDAKKSFLQYINELKIKEHNCSAVDHTNHSNHNNW